MNFRALFKNASVAFLAQGVAFIVSVVTTLLVPKILGVEQYGYWQLFIFYQSYVGFFHLGLNDGVYLVCGGQTRNEIDKKLCNSQMIVGTGIQTLFAVIVMAAVCFADLGNERTFILICTAAFLVVKNLADYIGYLFQAMNETIQFSKTAMLERLVFLVLLIVLIVLGVDSFEYYVSAYLIAGLIRLAYCLFHARDFLISGFIGAKSASVEVIKSVAIGIKLMLANIASMLILGFARFFIDLVWGIETFGKLSLSLSMVNFFLAFVSQFAMVLFPALRQGNPDVQKKFFVVARETLSLLFPFVYILYFPLKWILSWWLPAYADSLVFIAFLLPICVFDSKMNICCTTMFKVRREERLLLKINLAIALLSCSLTLVGVYVFGSVYYVIFGVVVSIAVRSLVAERILAKALDVTGRFMLVAGEIILSVVFVILVAILPEVEAIVIYSVCYSAFLLANRKDVGKLAQNVKKLGVRDY